MIGMRKPLDPNLRKINMIRKSSLLKAIFAAAILATGNAAYAQDKAPGSGPNPFTDCGIGAALFSETKWAAVTSNVIWDIGTTAVISATASPQTCSGKKVAALAFVGKTHNMLAEEAARGKGEHLVSVLNLLDCKPANQGAAIASIRAGMATVVAKPGYAGSAPLDKAANVYNVVEHAVASTCAV
jgi:hypothetical protein